MTYVIGITGSLGAGKSTVAGMFAELGAKVLDADKIAHRQIRPKAPCFDPIVKAFGEGILTAGRIDRKRIAARVFHNPRERRRLQNIIHPQVRRVIKSEIKRYKKSKRRKVIILDVPLLFESKLDREVDMTIVVKTNRTVQVARVTKLFKLTKAEVAARIKVQMPLRQKIRLADIIIDNNATLKQTKKQVIQIWKKL